MSVALLAAAALHFTPPPVVADSVADSIRTVTSQQVVVTGTRSEVRLKNSPVRVEVIGQDRIRTTAMITMADLLKEQTGLLLSGNVRTGVQMNGLGPDYTLILIDGQPMVGRVAGVIDLSRVSVGNIERIEVVKGPMSSMYGSEALAGVINIITKRPADGWTARLYGQGISRGPLESQAEVGWGSDSIEISTFFNYKNQASYSLTVDTVTTPYNGFQDGTIHTKFQWRLPEGWKVDASVRAFGSVTRGTFTESLFGQIAENSGSVRQSDISATAGVDWQHGRAQLTTKAYVSTYFETYEFDVDQGGKGAVDDLERRIARLYSQYHLLVGETNMLSIGGEFLYDDVGGTRYSDTVSPDKRPFYRTGVAFAQWEGRPVDWISYVLSARFDGNNVFGEAVSPRFSVLWKPDPDHVRLSGSIGTGFKAPDFRHLFIQFSNRLPGAGYDLIGAAVVGNDLLPERSVSVDIGLRYEDAVREFSSTATLLYDAEIRFFRNDLRNLIEFYLYDRIGDRPVYSYRNLARATTQGFETSVKGALVLRDIGVVGLSVGYQYLDTYDTEVLQAIDAGTAGTIDKRLTRSDYGGLWGRSRHSGTARLQYDSPDRSWSANIRAQYVGRYGDESLDKNGFVISEPARLVLDRDDEYVASYIVLNVAARYSFALANRPVTIGLGMNNILDILRPTLIPGLVGRQLFVQMNIGLLP